MSTEHAWTVIGVYAAVFLALSIVLLLRRDLLESPGSTRLPGFPDKVLFVPFPASLIPREPAA